MWLGNWEYIGTKERVIMLIILQNITPQYTIVKWNLGIYIPLI